MSYLEAMEAAGAEILAFDQFGSYQGDWWAKVRYRGEVGWVTGSYGSCSGCDAFEAEFGWREDASYDQARLAAFGMQYLDTLYTQEEAEKSASKYSDWDIHAEDAVNFLRENAIE